MQAYSDPARASDPHALPNLEIFLVTKEMVDYGDFDGEPGWYFWFCFPGCMPDSDPEGPFVSSEEALKAARDEQ